MPAASAGVELRFWLGTATRIFRSMYGDRRSLVRLPRQHEYYRLSGGLQKWCATFPYKTPGPYGPGVSCRLSIMK